jgi:hypothetical protein
MLNGVRAKNFGAYFCFATQEQQAKWADREILDFEVDVNPALLACCG